MAFARCGIARVPLEDIAEAPHQAVHRVIPAIAPHWRSAGVIELAQIVDAVAMVGMVVRPDNRVNPVDMRRQQLVSHIGRCVDQDPRRLGLDDDRCAAACVARFGRIAIAPVAADPRDTRRRSAAKDDSLHAGGFALANRRKKLALVASARASGSISRKSARKRAVSAV